MTTRAPALPNEEQQQESAPTQPRPICGSCPECLEKTLRFIPKPKKTRKRVSKSAKQERIDAAHALQRRGLVLPAIADELGISDAHTRRLLRETPSKSETTENGGRKPFIQAKKSARKRQTHIQGHVERF